MRTGIILASHGDFAKAALNSAIMIIGPQEHVCAISLNEEMSLEQFEEEIETCYQNLSEKCEPIIVLCDIYGGTPFNAIARCVMKGMKMNAYSGFSLPLLLDLLLCRDLKQEEIEERIMDTQAIVLSPILAVENLNEEVDHFDL